MYFELRSKIKQTRLAGRYKQCDSIKEGKKDQKGKGKRNLPGGQDGNGAGSLKEASIGNTFCFLETPSQLIADCLEERQLPITAG
jgi:hypothetical protein